MSLLRTLCALAAMLASMDALAARTPCAVGDLAGLASFPMPTDLDFSRAPWDVAVVADAGADGKLSSLRIARSSGSRLIDASALSAAGKIRVTGKCLATGSGPLYLVFNPTFHDKGPDHALARAWRSDLAPGARRPGPAIPMDFIAGPYVAEVGNQLTSQGDYACSGEVVTALVHEIPPDDDVLSADEIHELSSRGKVLGKWRVPLEANPLAVDGDALIVAYRAGAERFATVHRDGRIEVAPAMAEPPADVVDKCPASLLPDSGYRWCARLVDATTGKSRLIAFNGPCT